MRTTRGSSHRRNALHDGNATTGTCVSVEWIPSRGTRHWLCFNDLEVLLLAQGLSTDRIQQQAQVVAQAIDPEETP